MALSTRGTETMVLSWALKVCHEIFVLRVKLKFEILFQTLDLHLFLSKEKALAINKRPNLPTSLISCFLGRESKSQLVEFNNTSTLNHLSSINSDLANTEHLKDLRL